jgi:hypothetical protein
VQSTWSPAQRLHLGDLAWRTSGGAMLADPEWSREWHLDHRLVAWADARTRDAVPEFDVHLSADAGITVTDELVHTLQGFAEHGTVELSDRDRLLGCALARAGATRVTDGAWFVHLWRSLSRDLPGCRLPTGYVVRPVHAEETVARAALHRAVWAPARIKDLLGLPVTGDEDSSGFSDETYARVRADPDYRRELDMVVVAPDGSLVAYALGWLDERHRSLLIEPLGTAPSHAGRGLGHAVCSALLAAAARLGATQAVARPRGDDGYPVPRHLYTRLGMTPVARGVTYAW